MILIIVNYLNFKKQKPCFKNMAFVCLITVICCIILFNKIFIKNSLGMRGFVYD